MSELEQLKIKVKELEAKEKQLKKEEKLKLKKTEQNSKYKSDRHEYDAMKADVEKTWFKLIEPACFARETEDGISYKSLADARHIFDHYRVTILDDGKYEDRSFFDIWRKDPTIRVYDRVVFKPSPLKIVNGEYNLFKGFPKRKECKKVNIDLFHEHMDTLTNGEEKPKKYLYAYLADIIQNPARQNASHSKCIVIKGEQGSSKGLLHQLIENLLTDKYVAITENVNSVVASETNRFAAASVNKFVLFLDEMSYAAGHSKSESLKSYISAMKIHQEMKGISGQFSHLNFTRFFVLTNNKQSVKVEASDRRYIVLNCSSRHVNDQEWIDKIVEAYYDEDFLYSVYKFLKNYDIENFNFKDTPKTVLYNQMKMHNISHVVRFIASAVDDKLVTGRVKAPDLFLLFQEYMHRNNNKAEFSSLAFYNELADLIEEKAGVYKKKSSSVQYWITAEEFKEYCKKKNYPLFEVEGKEEEQVQEKPAVKVPKLQRIVIEEDPDVYYQNLFIDVIKEKPVTSKSGVKMDSMLSFFK